MPKFRKKPVVIEAVRVAPDAAPALRALAEGSPTTLVPYMHGPGGSLGYVEVQTLEGTMIGQQGDWIIRGVAGELYPCQDSIFRATYEPAD